MLFFNRNELRQKYLLEEDVPVEDTGYELPEEESDTGEENNPNATTGEDDYTLPEDDEGEEESEADGYELPEDEEDTEEEPVDDESYELPEEGEEDTEDEESVEEDPVSEPTDELTSKENELFKDINADAIKIRNKELLNNYIELYKLVASLPSRIENIPKTEKSISSINFLGDKIEEVRSLIFMYIENNFSIKTYIENLNQYYKFISIMSQIEDGISKIAV